MTCVVGLSAKGKIWIGGDAAGFDTETYRCVAMRDTKVFKLGTEYLVGFAGSYRFGQLLRYKFVPPEKPEGQDDYEFLVTDFMDVLRNTMKDEGIVKIENSIESLDEAGALVGFNGKLYNIEEDFQIGEMVLPYCAIGSGADYSYGSLDTSFKISKRMAPRKRVLMALEAASAFSSAVRPPFTIMSL